MRNGIRHPVAGGPNPPAWQFLDRELRLSAASRSYPFPAFKVFANRPTDRFTLAFR